jgi:tetratricopeptide (TPR) repeat protein
MGLGGVATSRADLNPARLLLEEALQVGSRSGESAALALSLAWSADLAYALMHYAEARQFAEEALRVADSVGFATPACMALSTLGNLSYQLGDRDGALLSLEGGLERSEKLGEAWPIVRAALGLALIACDDRDLGRARSLLARSVQLAQRVGNRHHLALAFEGVATFATVIEQPDASLRFAGAAAAIRASIGALLTPAEQHSLDERLACAWQSLEASAVGVFEEGKTWSAEQSITQALELLDGPPEQRGGRTDWTLPA